jgi:hypothetical protein
MINAQSDPGKFVAPSPEEMQSALFAQLVMQQASMAMMLLGKTPNPQTGKTMRDLEGARFFIDQLEMLEIKTKGNLSREEQGLLKQNLMALRLAFVEAVEKPAPAEKATEIPTTEPETNPISAPMEPADEAGSQKRFSKKY